MKGRSTEGERRVLGDTPAKDARCRGFCGVDVRPVEPDVPEGECETLQRLHRNQYHGIKEIELSETHIICVAAPIRSDPTPAVASFESQNKAWQLAPPNTITSLHHDA